MKVIFLLLVLLFAGVSSAQNAYSDSLRSARQHHDSTFLRSVLNDTERAHTPRVCYFEPDENYIVVAKFTRVKGKKFAMPMTKERNTTVYYRKYGKLEFTLNGTPCELFVYENLELKKKPAFKNYLFLPFRDATSGNETYGGGRFIDLEKSESGFITVDFNSCYNPYCAYSERYSCPVVPAENLLQTEVKAGSCYEGHD